VTRPVRSWCRFSTKLVRRYEKPPVLPREVVTSEAAARYLHHVVAEWEQEVLGALFLDSGNHAMGYTAPFQGSSARAAAEPRLFLQRALLANAEAMILFHNRQGAATKPSPEDIRFTRRMILAGGLVGVVVIDYLILGAPPTFTSVVRHAKLQPDSEPVLTATAPEDSTPLLMPLTDLRQRVRPKYRHPVTGATWSGRGHMAKWLGEEIAAGGELEDFRIADQVVKTARGDSLGD